MKWTLWHPMVLQSDDCMYRIYKGTYKGALRYRLMRNTGDMVWETIAVALAAEELKAMLEEEAA